MRKFFVSVLFTITGIVVFGQMDIGVDYYYLGEYKFAKEYIEKELAKNPARANFFLGEIAFKEGNMEKAESYYNSGLAAEPNNLLNQIGLAKLLLKKDAGSGDIALYNLHRKNSKNLDIVIAIGRAYLDNGMFEKAEVKLKEARSIHNKNAKVNIFDGDILVAKKDVKLLGDAAGKYDMALYFDPNNCLTYFKIAEIYERNNLALSIEYLETVIEKCPDYKIARRILGKISSQNGLYSKAITAYQTYFSLTDQQTIDDIEKYAGAYYFSGTNEEAKGNHEGAKRNYKEAKVLVERGLKTDPNHFILNRYLMYILAKTENLEDGLKQVEKFFSLPPDISGYIYLDYTMYASILKKVERYNEAIEQYDIAIQLEPDKAELYKEASDIAKVKKDFGLAAMYYKNFMAKKAEQERKTNPEFEDQMSDLYALSFNYYSAGVTISRNLQLAEELIQNESIINNIVAENKEVNIDSLKTNIPYFIKQYSLYNLNKADAVVDILIEKIEQVLLTEKKPLYTGHRLKALVKYAINPDVKEGPAKPYYERVVEIITSQEEVSTPDKQILLEAYNYLGYHYFLIGDKPNTILYWNKVLEIDPQNENAIKVLNETNKK